MIMVTWVEHKFPDTSLNLPYWEGQLDGKPVVHLYDLTNKDWLVVGLGPKGKHAGISLFHVPFDRAVREATALVRDLWG